MQILYLDSVDSTQTYLKKLVREKEDLPLAVVAKMQTAGIGSRDNCWKSLKGNLFLSFAIKIENLPNDLKLESASIYFAYILKETLNELNSKVWLKWPNDFYIDDKKIGGMITNIVDDTLVCGVGLNINSYPVGFAKVDIELCKEKLLENYFTKLGINSSWKQVFSKYQLEFGKNKTFFTHDESLKISLQDVELENDGSIISNGKRIYSLR
ncbi:MAG: biotin--[acetyl-CoA-carboxylase] ligase [Campylobacterota bacterium]|nr:biotin--[acetyl-CoA-carboxylase] ligase [Campylobacterota bacterium]